MDFDIRIPYLGRSKLSDIFPDIFFQDGSTCFTRISQGNSGLAVLVYYCIEMPSRKKF